MDINSDNSQSKQNRISFFINKNKKKILISTILIILLCLSLIFFQINNNRKNILLSEKFMNAQIYLSIDKKIKALNIYEELIKSKNKFYSNMALNMIIENDLEKDSSIVLNYFEIIENITKDNKQKDLINFKKALYLIEISKAGEGKKILQKLSDKESDLKFMIDEILEE
mgnify:CR=1 FL=1